MLEIIFALHVFVKIMPASKTRTALGRPDDNNRPNESFVRTHLFIQVSGSTAACMPPTFTLPPPRLPFLFLQSSNELKGQSTNKTISRNESLRCVNALLIQNHD